VSFFPDFTPKPIATRTTVDGRTAYLWRPILPVPPFTRFSFPLILSWEQGSERAGSEIADPLVLPPLPPLSELCTQDSIEENVCSLMNGMVLHFEQAQYAAEHGGLE